MALRCHPGQTRAFFFLCSFSLNQKNQKFKAHTNAPRVVPGPRTKTPKIYKSFVCLKWKDEDPDSCYAEQLEALYSVLLSLKKYYCLSRTE